MAARLTKSKQSSWMKRLVTARDGLDRTLDEVRACTANPKAKHYQDLCDLRTDLNRTIERISLCMKEAERMKP